MHQASRLAHQHNRCMTNPPTTTESRMKLDFFTSDWFGVLGSGLVAALVVAMALASPLGG
jgi:hypothetical protein